MLDHRKTSYVQGARATRVKKSFRTQSVCASALNACADLQCGHYDIAYHNAVGVVLNSLRHLLLEMPFVLSLVPVLPS